MRFKDKVVMVTGGAAGIGRVTARALAAMGLWALRIPQGASSCASRSSCTRRSTRNMGPPHPILSVCTTGPGPLRERDRPDRGSENRCG